ncbi:MAG: hypothetical protein Q8830_03670 [Candidatus Phytoplasma australasiaticum]|nr:hypothetical protein [Candidatus Phytoplasma australasiaticum]
MPVDPNIVNITQEIPEHNIVVQDYLFLDLNIEPNIEDDTIPLVPQPLEEHLLVELSNIGMF